MNKKSWEKTPPDLQKIIMDVVGNPFATTHGLDKKTYATMMKEIKAKGVDVYDLPAAQQAEWSKKFQNATREWVANLEKKGLKAKEAVIMYTKVANEMGTQCVATPPEWVKK